MTASDPYNELDKDVILDVIPTVEAVLALNEFQEERKLVGRKMRALWLHAFGAQLLGQMCCRLEYLFDAIQFTVPLRKTREVDTMKTMLDHKTCAAAQYLPLAVQDIVEKEEKGVVVLVLLCFAFC